MCNVQCSMLNVQQTIKQQTIKQQTTNAKQQTPNTKQQTPITKHQTKKQQTRQEKTVKYHVPNNQKSTIFEFLFV